MLSPDMYANAINLIVHVSRYMCHGTCVTVHVSRYMCHGTCVTVHVSRYMCHSCSPLPIAKIKDLWRV